MPHNTPQVGDPYDRGLNALLYSVAGFSAIAVLASIIGLAKGNAGWGVLPLLLGCPVATWLAVQGRQQAWMTRSVIGMAVLLLALGLAAILFKLTG
jgi:hypothetical protein